MTDGDHRNEAEEEDVASPVELRRGIEALGVGDIKKLKLIARFWWSHYELQGRSGGPEDLLQDAIERCLKEGDDRRRWPKKRTTLVKFLDGVIRSIASHEVESAVRERKREDAVYALGATPRPSGSATPVRPQPSPNAESRVAAREELEDIEALFDGHPRTLEALRCKAQGMTEGEIRKALQIDQREMERIKKQILRAFVTYKKSNGDDHGNQ